MNRNISRLWIVVAAALAAAATARAGEGPADLKKFIEQVDATTKTVPAVSYDAEWFMEGPAAAQAPKVSGKLIVKRSSQEALAFRVEGTATMPSGEERKFAFASNGTEGAGINYRRKRFETGKGNEALRAAGPAQRLYMQEFNHPTPFQDELNGTSKCEGIVKIGGVDCYKVHVKYTQQGQEAYWYWGKDDYLPRRVDRFQGENKACLVLSNVNVKPEISGTTLTLECPEGFAKTKFGPPPQPRDEPMLENGSAAPAWELTDAAGKNVTLEGLKGKVVVLYFWATFSDPAKENLAMLNALHRKFEGKPVAIYGVSTWERGGDPAKLMSEKGYGFGLLMKGDDMSEEYKVESVPTTYVIDADGKVAYGGPGDEVEAELADIIEKALAAKK